MQQFADGQQLPPANTKSHRVEQRLCPPDVWKLVVPRDYYASPDIHAQLPMCRRQPRFVLWSLCPGGRFWHEWKWTEWWVQKNSSPMICLYWTIKLVMRSFQNRFLQKMNFSCIQVKALKLQCTKNIGSSIRRYSNRIAWKTELVKNWLNWFGYFHCVVWSNSLMLMFYKASKHFSFQTHLLTKMHCSQCMPLSDNHHSTYHG